MPRTDKRRVTRRVTRRDFVRSSAAAIAATGLSFGAALPSGMAATTQKASPALVNLVMQAAAVGVTDINAFLKRSASDFELLKNTKLPPKHLEESECTKALNIIDAVVAVVVACVIATFTFGAGATLTAKPLNQAKGQIATILARLAELEALLIKQKKVTEALAAAIVSFRRIAADVNQVLVARDVFFHISQDRAYVTGMLEAALAGNHLALDEMLKRDVPGSNVVIQNVKADDGGFTMTVRTGSLTQCLSTGSQCSGKTFAITR